MPQTSLIYQTILLLENEEDDVMLLTEMFKRARLLNPIQILGTVEDTISYLKGEGVYADRKKYPFPILMLLDLHVSGGSSFEVLEWVRSHPSPRPLKAVILTGSNVRAIQEAYKLGAHSFLTKPLKFEDFDNMVQGLRGISLAKSDNGRFLHHSV